MKFFERIQSRVGKIKEPNHLKNWIAACPSRYPATDGTKYWLPHVNSAREAQYALFLAEFRPYWETMEIYDRIRNLAYQFRYEGNWEVVQNILEHNSVGSLSEKIWLEFQSADDFFGNFLEEVNLFLRRNDRVFRSYDERRKAKHKVRRRGYQDKGSLRPSFKRYRNFGDPNPGEDRRKFIRHPLLSEDEYLPEGIGEETHPPDPKERR